jgi:hypothetical protein
MQELPQRIAGRMWLRLPRGHFEGKPARWELNGAVSERMVGANHSIGSKS